MKRPQKFNLIALGIVVVVLAVVGVYVIFKSHAATNNADFNGSTKVDITDLSILAAHFGTTSGATHAQGDANGDGAVNVTDLSILATQFNTTVGGGSGGSCPAGWPVGAPCAATTGPAADGVSSLKPLSSSNWNSAAWGSTVGTISVSGATIQGYDIPFALLIKASNVTLRDDKIHVPSPGNNGNTGLGNPICPCSANTGSGNDRSGVSTPFGVLVEVDSFGTGDPYTGLKVLYSELDGGGRSTQTPSTNGQTYDLPYAAQACLAFGQYTADHNNIHGCGNNLLLRTNTTISSNYIWGLAQNSKCFTDPTMSNNNICDHLDAVENSNGSTNQSAGQSSIVTANMVFGNWNSCVFSQPSAAGQNIANTSFSANWCSSNAAHGYVAAGGGGSETNVAWQKNRLVRYPQNPWGLTPDIPTDIRYGTICGTVYDDNNTLLSGQSACP